MRWREAPATVALAVATLVASLLILAAGLLPAASLGGGVIAARFAGAALPPDSVAVPLWLTPLSATLIHAGLVHLLFNLVMLGFCGVQVERAVGARGLLLLYLVGAYAAALGQWLLAPTTVTPVIGASGAISAVVGAYALLFGERRPAAVGPIPSELVHIVWLAAAWIGIQALIGLSGMGMPGGGGASIAVGAHVGGFLAGLLLARPLLRWRYRHA